MNAVFTFRTLSGGANILRILLSSDGLLGSGSLFFDGDLTLEQTSYDHTAATVSAVVSASSSHPTYGLFSDLWLSVAGGPTVSVVPGGPRGPSMTVPLPLAFGVNDFTFTMVSEDGRTTTAHPVRITRYATITASNHTVTGGHPAPTITATTQPSGITFTTPPTCTTAYDAASTDADWTQLPTSCTGAAATGYLFRYVNGAVTVTGGAVGGPDEPTGLAIATVDAQQLSIGGLAVLGRRWCTECTTSDRERWG